MTTSNASSHIRESQLEIKSTDLQEASSIEPLYKLWLELERRLGEYGDLAASEDEADTIIHTQSVIIDQCALIPAVTVREVLCKLAMWRGDTPDLPPSPATPLADTIAYSAFCDLIRLTGDEEFLQQADDTHRKRGSLSPISPPKS